MKKRRPVSIGAFREGATCYIPRREIEDRIKSAPVARSWRFRNSLRAAMIGQTLMRPVENFGPSISLEDLGQFVEDSARLGVPDPANFGDVFHRVFRSPRVKWTINAIAQAHFKGGWEAALSDRADAGARLYDLCSAYAWAGARPMPDPNSATLTNEYRLDGIYDVEVTLAPGGRYPPGLRGGRCRAFLTVGEMELYSAKDIVCHLGLYFRKWHDLADPIYRIADVHRWHKPILRAYWGRWACQKGVTCQVAHDGAVSKEWTLPPIGANFLWAHMITSLVRGRVWEEVCRGGVHHVFTDSIVTDRRIDTGSRIGSWVEKQRFDRPLRFYHPGNWGYDGGERIKHSGYSAKDAAENCA